MDYLLVYSILVKQWFCDMHCLDVTTQPNEPDQLLKEVKFPRFYEKNPD